MSRNNGRLNIRASTELIENLRVGARRSRLTMSEAVKIMIRDFLNGTTKPVKYPCPDCILIHGLPKQSKPRGRPRKSPAIGNQTKLTEGAEVSE